MTSSARRGRLTPARALLILLVALPAAVALDPTAPTACAAGTVQVALVIDTGASSPQVTATCVGVGDRATGYDVLEAGASVQIDPRTGLVCRINGVPATGCGEQTGDKFAYWAYYRGTSAGWTYSNQGPTRVRADTTEGWRFQPAGSANPSDPAPRHSAAPASVCVPPTTAPTTVPPAQPGPGPAPTTGTAPSAGPGVPVGPNGTAATDPGVLDATSTSAAADGLTSTAAPGATSDARPRDDSDVEDELWLRASDTSGSNGGPSPIGTLVGSGAVAGLAITAAVVARRRQAGTG